MAWLLLTLFAYVLFAVVALGDKFFLTGSVKDPKLYAFYVGFLGLIVFALTPFLGLPVPEAGALAVALLAGGLFIVADYFLYFGLHYFEASRMIPAIGGLVPMFTLLMSILILDVRLEAGDGWAFAALVAGTILITWQGFRKLFSQTLAIAFIASLLFGASFALSKYAYLHQSFWSGFIWIRAGGGIVAFALLALSSGVREEVRRAFFPKRFRPRGERTAGLFLLNQCAGAGAVVLQSLAVFLVPVTQLAFVNALQGVQYVFLLLFTLLISLKYPRAKIHEYVSGSTLFHKFLAILLIGIGLLILSPAF